MADIKSRTDLVLSGEMTIIDYICEKSAIACNTPEGQTRPSDIAYWEMVRDAHKNGKKLIFISGPVPTEILYAMDCVPLYIDLIPSRISEDEGLTAKLINEAETRSNPNLCGLNKTNTGVLLSGNLGLEPDAYVTLPISCDSARTAYAEMGTYIKAPAYHFDIPLRTDEGSIKYVEMQFGHFIEFMEEVTERKLDWEQVKYRMELSDKSGRLLEECARLRRNKPCPMSSHMTIWNELMNAFAPTKEMEKLLTQELDICNDHITEGYSPCPNGEKHRILLLHNLLWQGIDITEWLESQYGAATVMDGFCFRKREFFTRLDDKQDCIRIMSKRIISGSRAHGAGVAGEELFETIEDVLSDYGPDVFIFMGNVGCRHAWAATKMLSDSIQEKYGISMLSLDIDNTDRRYKSEKEIKTAISDYMDTVVNKH